ncbi:hypothetical protein [Xanthobacter versatilis]|uniref:hypothetical protein n=1 Tax=Xanthobacter autotrophicus (strain ATCC BAA-1158 / Py2) TaxID=78245 RepID=UPI00372C33E7
MADEAQVESPVVETVTSEPTPAVEAAAEVVESAPAATEEPAGGEVVAAAVDPVPPAPVVEAPVETPVTAREALTFAASQATDEEKGHLWSAHAALEDAARVLKSIEDKLGEEFKALVAQIRAVL